MVFTKQFAPKVLFSIKAAAANLNYSFLSPKIENMLVTIYSLNPSYYMQPNWAVKHADNTPWKPYPTLALPQKYKIKVRGQTDLVPKEMQPKTYGESVAYNTGWFKSEFLLAKELDNAQGQPLATHQAFAARYNPNKDNGQGNEIYCVALTSDRWDPPSKDKNSIHSRYATMARPIWILLIHY